MPAPEELEGNLRSLPRLARSLRALSLLHLARSRLATRAARRRVLARRADLLPFLFFLSQLVVD